MELKSKAGQAAHHATLSRTMKGIFTFHLHHKWLDSYKSNFDSWERVFGKSDYQALKGSFQDWEDAQTGEFLKPPMPKAVRGYYTQRMEKVRMIERENSQSSGGYEAVMIRSINFKIVSDSDIQKKGGLILKMREARIGWPGCDKQGRFNGHDKAPMSQLSDSIVAEYHRRFPNAC